MAAAVLRKRKIIDTNWGDEHLGATQPARKAPPRVVSRPLASRQQPSIARFGRVSKLGAAAASINGTKLFAQKLPSANLSVGERQVEAKKRKPQPVGSIEPTELQEPPQRPITPPPTSAKAKKASLLPPSQPGEPRRIAPLKRSRQSVAESPTQGARAILEAFVLAAPASSGRETTPTPPTAPIAAVSYESNAELVTLHAAFLNALSLHYAHEGTSSPADLRQLTSSITRIWGRRRVTAEDVQQVLGVQQSKASAEAQSRTDLPDLTIVDFGKGRLGIEYEASTAVVANTITSPLPIPSLKRIFAANLLTSDPMDLPKADITPFMPTSALTQRRGTARLADLKAAALNAQVHTARSEGRRMDIFNSKGPDAPLPQTTQPASRSASLLARICAKEVQIAAQPTYTQADRSRDAALQRLEDVIPVIEALITGKGTSAITGDDRNTTSAARDLAADLGLGMISSRSGGVSTAASTGTFTFPMLVQHLQNSLRHPIAKDEAEMCLRLLAKEVVPWWASLRRIGATETVCFRGTVRRTVWMSQIEAARRRE